MLNAIVGNAIVWPGWITSPTRLWAEMPAVTRWSVHGNVRRDVLNGAHHQGLLLFNAEPIKSGRE